MKTQDFRSLPPAGQEQLRRKAVDAVLSGMTLVAAARVFGVTRQAVGSWMDRYEEAGPRALKAQRRGRPRGRRGRRPASPKPRRLGGQSAFTTSIISHNINA